MTSFRDSIKQGTRWVGRGAVLLVFSGGVIVSLLWLAGKFSPKVPTDRPHGQPPPPIAGELAPARLIELPRSESAVGTIRAVHETSIGSNVLGRVVEVDLKSGQPVKAGDVLVRIDDTELRARLQQANAAVEKAEAARSQAAVDEQRFRALIESQAVSQQEYDNRATALRLADAELSRARETAKEAQAMLEWATIRSPIDGTVINKKVDVGDMATPGQVLVTLFDPTRMQLVASVRESLTRRLRLGQDIGVRIDGLEEECHGTVSEIVPEAETASRTFQVKVTGPCPAGIYSGMFGRIVIPLEEEQVLVVPRRAVRKVGQLELLDVAEDGRAAKRAIRTGRTLGDQVEVLSGLSEGEKVVLPAITETAEEAARD
jgi:membrane fusion protein (multidrug efflux system)